MIKRYLLKSDVGELRAGTVFLSSLEGREFICVNDSGIVVTRGFFEKSGLFEAETDESEVEAGRLVERLEEMEVSELAAKLVSLGIKPEEI